MTDAAVYEMAATFLATRAAVRSARMAELNSRCEKVSYFSEQEARRNLSRIREQAKDEIWVPIRYYRCDLCTLHHLTSTPLDNNGKPMRTGEKK